MAGFDVARSAFALARVAAAPRAAAASRSFPSSAPQLGFSSSSSFSSSSALASASPLAGAARYGRPSAKASPVAARLASYSESAKGRGAHMTTSASLPAAEHAEGSGRARRPVGPFRAGIVGFLAGSVIAGVVTYYYILKEYRVSNDLLMTDIYNLQKAINRTEAYVHALEGRSDPTKKTRLGD